MAELLFWPALLAYGEAAVAYFGNARRPGSLGTLATWGVRVGRLAQTALLVVQAARADGFPWSTWAGTLNLFVWLVVSAYLIWGCRPSYRLLGLAVMPVAAVLLAVAYAGGGMAEGADRHLSTLFLVAHVGFVLAGVAGFTLAAGLAALYLWEERRLKRREPRILRFGVPSIVALEELTARVIAVSLAVFTAGMVAGFARLEDFDARMGVSIGTAGVYGAYLALRGLGWRGRRSAWLAVGGCMLALVLLAAVHG
jgi:ABC-type transport system involved in cytochrome c biogenesis permease subunit